MATDDQLVQAFAAAATVLLGRPLKQAEVETIIDDFDNSEGERLTRMRLAIARAAGITTLQLQRRIATDYVVATAFEYADKTVQAWKPGT